MWVEDGGVIGVYGGGCGLGLIVVDVDKWCYGSGGVVVVVGVCGGVGVVVVSGGCEFYLVLIGCVGVG